jgi:(2Fe-2S) ferredoxin
VPHYERHVFVCCNQRPADDPRGCCAAKDADAVRDALKARLKQLGLNSQIRANKAGCLDQCKHGVTVVVYPEQVWYRGVTVDDVEELVQEHLVAGRPVQRLRLE